LLDTQQIRSRFPQFNLIGDEHGYYEPAMGFLRPEKAVAAQIALAEKVGAEVRTNERVLDLLPQSSEVRVRTAAGEYAAEQVVVSAGAWLPQLLGKELSRDFAISRQVLYWFGV